MPENKPNTPKPTNSGKIQVSGTTKTFDTSSTYSMGGKQYYQGTGESAGTVLIIKDVKDPSKEMTIQSHKSVYYPSSTSAQEIKETESSRQQYRGELQSKELAQTQ